MKPLVSHHGGFLSVLHPCFISMTVQYMMLSNLHCNSFAYTGGGPSHGEEGGPGFHCTVPVIL